MSGSAYDDGVRGIINNSSLTSVDVPATDATAVVTAMPYNNKSILVQWDYELAPSLKDFVIYRQRQGEPLRELKTLVIEDGKIANPAPVRHSYFYQNYLDRDFYYLDLDIRRGGTYEYRIIARHYDGGFSQMSSVLSIIVN